MKLIALNLFILSNLMCFGHYGLIVEPDFSDGYLDAPVSTAFEEPEVMGAENFAVERKDGKMYIGFDIIIKNPNKLGFVIKPSSLFLTIADVDMGWVRVEKKIKIKRKSELSYPFALKGNASDFVKSAFSGVWSLILGKGVNFRLKGTVKAGVFFFKKKWKIDFTYNMTNDEFMSLF